MRKFLVILAFGATALTACGGDSASSSGSGDASKLSGDDKTAVEAITAKLAEDGGGINEGVSADQEACVAIGMVKQLGAKRVLELSKADELVMNDAEAGKAADVFLGCVDVGKIMADGIAEDGSISQKSATCLAGKIDKKLMRTAIVNEFSGKSDSNDDVPPELMTSLLEGMTKCLTKEELTKMGQN